MIEGVKISMAGMEYMVPPLSFKQLKVLAQDIEGLGESASSGSLSAGQMDMAVRVIHAALLRNYPGMTIEQVEEMVDLGNFQDVVQAVLGAAGFKKSSNGEEGKK